MQISRESTAGNLIRAVEHDRVRIGSVWITGNIIVTAEEIVSDWAPADPAHLTIEDLEPALAFHPEVLIVGAGHRALTPDVELMAELGARSVGLEFMRTDAACRTFNVLVHEGRRVAAALIQGNG